MEKLPFVLKDTYEYMQDTFIFYMYVWYIRNNARPPFSWTALGLIFELLLFVWLLLLLLLAAAGYTHIKDIDDDN